jgi:hypothetical protein
MLYSYRARTEWRSPSARTMRDSCERSARLRLATEAGTFNKEKS